MWWNRDQIRTLVAHHDILKWGAEQEISGFQMPVDCHRVNLEDQMPVDGVNVEDQIPVDCHGANVEGQMLVDGANVEDPIPVDGVNVEDQMPVDCHGVNLEDKGFPQNRRDQLISDIFLKELGFYLFTYGFLGYVRFIVGIFSVVKSASYCVRDNIFGGKKYVRRK